MHIANVIIVHNNNVEKNHLFSAKNKSVLNSKIAEFLRGSNLFDGDSVEAKETSIKLCLMNSYAIAPNYRQVYISSPFIEKE